MDIREEFKQSGFVSEVDVLPMDRTAYYAEKCKAFIDSYKSHPDFSEWTYYRTELVLKWVAELASEESLLDVIEELIGPDILLWNAFLPVKPPRTDAYFGWHQDATYWPVSPTEQIVSAWIALSPVNQDCGGMQMVRRSHLCGALNHETTYDDSSMLKRGQQVTTPIDNKQIFDINLHPGQASIHHTLTLHRSGPNNSDNWRLGVGFNYVSAQVGPLPGYEDSAMPLRGNVEKSRFILTQAPQSDLDAAALESFDVALRRQSKRYSDVQDK
jgi:non-heme Fe2+,alpha-ketoglutarate-dependent halogenase